MITLEQATIAFIGLLITIVGYFIIRTIRHFDIMIAAHDKQLGKHEEAITELIRKITEISTNSDNINQKLDHIIRKIDSYDDNIREFYQKYDLPLKK